MLTVFWNERKCWNCVDDTFMDYWKRAPPVTGVNNRCWHRGLLLIHQIYTRLQAPPPPPPTCRLNGGGAHVKSNVLNRLIENENNAVTARSKYRGKLHRTALDNLPSAADNNIVRSLLLYTYYIYILLLLSYVLTQ